jgi:predicted ATPase
VGTLDAAARQDLLDKTSGNPLFVEETVRMLSESKGDYLPERIPDTLQALIAARIDGLPSAEKALLHRAAVIGRIFWHGAITHVAPDLDVDGLIDDLLLRDFLLAEPRSTIIGERAYRFKHMLIREVAYAGLSKGDRAELHRGFAEWLKMWTGDELLEIRAYHLDHAAQLLAELDGTPPAELAAEAAAALEEAGRRALARESNHAGRKLLLRALELEPTLERRFQAARAAWRMTELPTVSVEMAKVLEEARAAGDRQTEGRALSALAEVALLRDGDTARATELIDAALEALPAEGRFAALVVQGKIAWTVGDFEVMQEAAEETVEIAQRLGRKGPRGPGAERRRACLTQAGSPGRGGGDGPARAPARRGERQHRRARPGGVLARQRLPRQARRRPGEPLLEEARVSSPSRGHLERRADAERARLGGRAAG